MSITGWTNLETTAQMLGFSNLTITVDMTTREVIVSCEDADGNIIKVEVDGVQTAVDRMQAKLSALLEHE